MGSAETAATWLIALAMVGCSTGRQVEPGPAPSAATTAVVAASGALATASSTDPAAALSPDAVPRIAPEEARRKVQAGQALLVCAYTDDAKYQGLKLTGSISLHDLEQKVSSLQRDQEIIFYCA